MEDSFQFIPMASKSGVSDQPFSEEETRQGLLRLSYSDLNRCNQSGTGCIEEV